MNPIESGEAAGWWNTQRPLTHPSGTSREGLAMDATQTQVEIWKPVAGYEGRYSVSNLGRVKSLKRVTEPLHGGHPRICPETILKGEQNTRDHHYRVRLYINTETRRFLVHRLVLTAFVGPCPDGMVGCHNNGDPTDNRLENLRWDTQSANVRDQIAHGNHLQASKTHCKYGHEFAGENLAFDRIRNQRKCRTCIKRKNRQQYLRRLALQSAGNTVA